jgi:hypothetical protein
MLGTIVIGTRVAVQGDIVGRLPDGRMRVRVGEQIFVGFPPNPGESPAPRGPREVLYSAA